MVGFLYSLTYNLASMYLFTLSFFLFIKLNKFCVFFIFCLT